MEKISVIIPTLWKCTDNLINLIQILSISPYLGEIIIINNSCDDISNDMDNVIIHTPPKNLYVNPSWNLGVTLSKYNKFALLNDDILISTNLLESACNFLDTPNIGLIGVEEHSIVVHSIENIELEYYTDSKIEYIPVSNRSFGFGIAMFGNKSSYYEIPDELKVWCGDDYLIMRNNADKKQTYVVKSKIKQNN